MFSAILIGIICGVIGAAFEKSIDFVTELRENNSFLVFLLPFGGLLSVALYKLTKTTGVGTDSVLECARGEAEIPFLLLPVAFIASVITHLFGGSAGKEGAALQLGGTVAQLVAKVSRTEDEKHGVLIVCGMAALFCAVFGTPVGACVFALEIATVGSINVMAFLPVFVSSIAARFVSSAMGVVPVVFSVDAVPNFDLVVFLKTVAVAAIVAVASFAFCHMLHGGEKLFEKLLKNPFIRIFAGGCIIVVLTLIFGTDYNGGGIAIIEHIFEESSVQPEAFLLKIIFTVVTVSAGYKGGEIVPSFFIGATLGAVLSLALGLPVQFCAALGMIAFFSGVTNCPLAASVLSVELFGAQGFVLFATSAFVARGLSGRVSLYNEQKY